MSARNGQGFVAIWNSMAPGTEADFAAWHENEHMPERLAIPGFRRGTRWGNPAAAARYFTLYELDDAEIAKSTPYLDRLNAPTPWTRCVMANFRDNSRCVGAFTTRLGAMPGNFMIAAPLDGHPEPAATPSMAQAIMAIDGVLGCHVGLSDTATSSIATAEREGRSVGEPWGLILIALAEHPADDALTSLDNILSDHGPDLTPRSLELETHTMHPTV